MTANTQGMNYLCFSFLAPSGMLSTGVLWPQAFDPFHWYLIRKSVNMKAAGWCSTALRHSELVLYSDVWDDDVHPNEAGLDIFLSSLKCLLHNVYCGVGGIYALPSGEVWCRSVRDGTVLLPIWGGCWSVRVGLMVTNKKSYIGPPDIGDPKID